MGTMLSTLVGGDADHPAGADSGGPVTAVRSKPRWDELLEANRASGSQRKRLMVVYFSATWCGPCSLMGPLFNNMAGSFGDATFVKIDVDELPEVAKSFHVEAMPTFVLLKGGKEVSRVVGAKKDELLREIQYHGGSS